MMITAKKEGLDLLLGDLFQSMGNKRLQLSLELLKETELYGSLEKEILQIHSYDDLLNFASKFPNAKEISAMLKTKIIQDYSRIEDKITQLEAERESKLEAPVINFQKLANNTGKDLGKQIPATDFKPKMEIANEQDFQTYRTTVTANLVNFLKTLSEVEPISGFKPGDYIAVKSLTGFNLEDLSSSFYHGGNEDDIKLGTVGVVSYVPDKTRVVANVNLAGKDTSEIQWHFHPDEISHQGKNQFLDYLSLYGDLESAADAFFTSSTSKSMPVLIDDARLKIGREYAQRIANVASSLKKKYDLDDEQVNAIINKKDFVYECDVAQGKDQINLEFNKLARIARSLINFKTKNRITSDPEAVRTADDFTKYVTDGSDAATGTKDNSSFAKEVVKELSSLVLKQYYLKERECRIKDNNADVISETLDYLLEHDNKVWLRRLMLYNDRNLYRGGDPFAPPSEELQRVLKLETGDGCSYKRCTFCTEYAKADFFVSKPEEFAEHAKKVRETLGDDLTYIERIFLSGGNLFDLPTKTLLQYLKVVSDLFDNQRIKNNPRRIYTDLRRIEAFTRTEGILKKSVDEIEELVHNKLRLLYWGVESGSDAVLQYVNKGLTNAQTVEAANKIRKTNMDVSLMIMPGLGGMKHYEEHVIKTREIINLIQPRYTTFHTITPKPNTIYAVKMNDEVLQGTNRPLTDEEVVEQMYDIVSGLNDGYRSLVATYYPPSAKIAINPVSFRGYLHTHRDGGGKEGILEKLTEYFNDERVPSLALPLTEFNKNSRVRAIIKGQ